MQGLTRRCFVGGMAAMAATGRTAGNTIAKSVLMLPAIWHMSLFAAIYEADLLVAGSQRPCLTVFQSRLCPQSSCIS